MQNLTHVCVRSRLQHRYGKTGAKPSATGAAVHKLLEALPKARVVFCSATFASNLTEIALYAPRLGLVGQGLGFDKFAEMKRSLGRLGVVALECIAAELKRDNALLSRSLSYEGVSFETKAVEFAPHHLAAQITASAIWARISKLSFFADPLGKDGTGGVRAADVDRGVAYGAALRLWRNFLLWSKVDACFEEVQAAIAAGEAPVISLVTTDAAADKRVQKAADNLVVYSDNDSDYDSDDGSDDAGTAATEEVSADGMGSLVDAVNRVLKRMEAAAKSASSTVDSALLADCASIRGDLVNANLASVSALDLLTDRCRASGLTLAELTGRTHTFPLRSDGTRQPVKKLDNLKLRANFMAGKADVVVISQAASTGISLHSAVGAGNDKRRRHVVLQLAWAAAATLQSCGRSHRSGQRVPPSYVILSSGNLETRFSSVVGARIRSMSGTRGDGEAKCGHAGMDFAGEDMVGQFGTQAVTALYVVLTGGKPPTTWVQPSSGASDGGAAPFELTPEFAVVALDALHGAGWRPETTNTDPFDSKRFLNRLLGVTMADGLNDKIFQLYAHLVDVAVFQAKRRGNYNRERARTIRVDGTSCTVNGNEKHGGVRIMDIKQDRGVSFEGATKRVAELAGHSPAFMLSVAATRKGAKPYHILAYKSHDGHTRLVLRPSGKLSEMQISDLLARYNKVDDADAAAFKDGWQEEYASTTDSRITHTFVALLPVLKRWELVSSHSNDGIRTARVMFHSGQRALGIVVPSHVAQGLQRRVEFRARKRAEDKARAEAAAAQAAAGAVAPEGAGAESSVVVHTKKRKIELALERVAVKRLANESASSGQVLVVTDGGSVFARE